MPRVPFAPISGRRVYRRDTIACLVLWLRLRLGEYNGFAAKALYTTERINIFKVNTAFKVGKRPADNSRFTRAHEVHSLRIVARSKNPGEAQIIWMRRSKRRLNLVMYQVVRRPSDAISKPFIVSSSSIYSSKGTSIALPHCSYDLLRDSIA